MFEAVYQAVGSAHADRIIHRNLKPSNVMVGACGSRRHVLRASQPAGAQLLLAVLPLLLCLGASSARATAGAKPTIVNRTMPSTVRRMESNMATSFRRRLFP